MTCRVGWTSRDDNRPHSADASGGDDPWTRWVAEAWRAAADPQGRHSVPPVPRLITHPSADLSTDHAELLAWWAAPLQLLMYGLGWSRIDLGLERWVAAGRPTQEPVLAVVDRWLGRHVEDLLAWSYVSDVPNRLGQALKEGAGTIADFPAQRVADRYASRREDPLWQRVWGDGDPLHLTDHLLAPVTAPEGGHRVLRPYIDWTSPPGDDGPGAALVSGQYLGWYGLAAHYGLRRHPSGRSWRTDVVVTPTGWLGTYRWSSRTELWFRCRHEVHMLGN